MIWYVYVMVVITYAWKSIFAKESCCCDVNLMIIMTSNFIQVIAILNVIVLWFTVIK